MNTVRILLTVLKLYIFFYTLHAKIYATQFMLKKETQTITSMSYLYRGSKKCF